MNQGIDYNVKEVQNQLRKQWQLWILLAEDNLTAHQKLQRHLYLKPMGQMERGMIKMIITKSSFIVRTSMPCDRNLSIMWFTTRKP